ncbi:glycosyltransferase [Peribacillus loiseleuriae]|uniref:Capsular biosynthesis protein n=1 Tax=Peribacillus loiseleuriae TaxID=1679170 RepID=A0A0K9GZ64_9BACI|nr:glycosyltransferase [Peribacillus loiseleuriae]KMY51890.1 capsular biosynthesis protein [Peribacillus loiseleuriae]
MKKSILISVYDMEIGGIERSLVNMLESFDYAQYNVDLLVFEHRGDFMNLIPNKVNLLPQIDKYTVFRKPVIQCLKEGHYSVTLIRTMSRYVANIKAKARNLEEGSGYIQMQLTSKYSSYFMPKQKKQYDVAISYAWPHDVLSNRIDAKKKIAWIHTDYSKLEIDNKIDFEMWNRFDYIASISDECTHSFLTTYPLLKDKVILIENITSPGFIQSMAEDEITLNDKHNDTFTILSVGRLSYVKGFDLAVKALRLLHDKGFTNMKWYVVGYGGYETELEELIAKNNLEDSFVLLGKKTNPYPYIKACDIYVQPSRYEGKAVTVTEAQILGKPILITNYPTSGSQVEDGVDGIICDLSAEGIAGGIERLFMNEELRDTLINHTNNKDYSNEYELNKLYEVIEYETN